MSVLKKLSVSGVLGAIFVLFQNFTSANVVNTDGGATYAGVRFSQEVLSHYEYKKYGQQPAFLCLRN